MNNPVLSISTVARVLKMDERSVKWFARGGLLKKTGRGIALNDLRASLERFAGVLTRASKCRSIKELRARCELL